MRWMVLVVIAAACGKGSKKEEGSPAPEKRSGPEQIKECDPAKPFTEQQALAWHRTTNREKYEPHEYSFRDAGHGITELGASPCCDRGYIELGVFYNCKVYSD